MVVVMSGATRYAAARLPELCAGGPGQGPRLPARCPSPTADAAPARDAERGPDPAVEERAHRRLQEAEREAQALVEAAKRRGAALVEEGHREGLRQGHADAVAQAQPRLAGLAAALEEGAARLRAAEHDVRSRGIELAVDVAVLLAERIVGQVTAHHPEAALRAARAALAALPEPGDAVLRIHPDQHAILEAQREALLEGTEGLAAVRLVPDAAVAPGGVIVETPTSLVDASLATQLAEARRRLREDPW